MHVFVVALVVTMVNLMFWQIRRLHEKQAINHQIEQDARLPATSLGSIRTEIDQRGVAAVRFRRVELSGIYEAGHEVTIANRSFNGAPGRWVATPLRPDDGGPAVLVVRGWVPLAVGGDDHRPVKGVEPPQRRVTVEGYVEPTQVRGSIGPTDPPTGRLSELARVDVARVAKQSGPMVSTFFLQLVSQRPGPAAAPTPVPLPPLDEGPHRSYAGQWALFSLVVVIGYPLALRHNARIPRDPDGARLDETIGGGGDRNEPLSTDDEAAQRGS